MVAQASTAGGGARLFTAAWLYPVASPPVQGGAVAVRDGKIVAAGRRDEILNRYSGRVTDLPGCVLMPGLVNAHSHLELTHFSSWRIRRGIDYHPSTFVDWIMQVVKARSGLTHDEVAASVREGLRISLESGTTVLGEIVTDRSMIPVYLESPLRVRMYLEAIGVDPQKFDRLLEEIEESLREFPAEDLLPGISPHTLYTVADGLALELAALSRSSDLPLAIHLAEPAEEREFVFAAEGALADRLYSFAHWDDFIPAPKGVSPVVHADSLGLLTPRTLAVHCVHVDDEDVRLLRQRGASAVLCPRSNDRLAVGDAPVAQLKKGGVRLALGTDSLASNDSLSLFDEMRFLLDRFPFLAPDEALRMATVEGAAALDVPAGSLTEGMPADLLAVEVPAADRAESLAGSIVFDGVLREVYLGGVPLGKLS